MRCTFLINLTILIFTCWANFNAAVAETIEKPELEKQVPLALQGYDLVTYFNLSGAEVGVDSYQAVYQGKRYLFSSSSNQQKFAKNPQRYLPQYDAYCAHSVFKSDLMLANPSIYSVRDNKLFLFSTPRAQQQWMSDADRNFEIANKNWEFDAEKRSEEKQAQNLWKTNNKVKLFSF